MNTVQSYWELVESDLKERGDVDEATLYKARHFFYMGFSAMMDMSKKLAREIVHHETSQKAAGLIMRNLEIELADFADKGRISLEMELNDTRTNSPAR